MKKLNKTNIEKKVKQLDKEQPWNHLIELPYNIKTKEEIQKSSGKNLMKWARLEPILGVLIPGKRVLDIGCNDGFYSIMCKKKGASEVVGIDIDPLRIKKANFLKEIFEMENIKFISKNFFRIDNIPQQFDIVLCLGLLHRVSDPASLLTKISSFGTILILEWKYSPYDLFLPRVLFLEELRKNRTYQKFNPPYFRLSFSSIKEILKRKGFNFFHSFWDDKKRGILVAAKYKINETRDKPPSFWRRISILISLQKSIIKNFVFSLYKPYKL